MLFFYYNNAAIANLASYFVDEEIGIQTDLSRFEVLLSTIAKFKP